MSQLSHNDLTLTNGIVKVSAPLLNDWKLCSGPNIPSLNAFKDKILVYTPVLDDESYDSPDPTDFETELPRNHPLQANDASSSSNKRQRIASEEILKQEIMEEADDLPIPPADNSRSPSPVIERPTKPRRTLPNMTPVGNSTMIRAAPFASKNRATSATKQLNSNRGVMPTFNFGTTPVSHINKKAESLKLYEALSEEQKMVYQYIVNENKNVFFSGSAGTGKTVLLRAIISKFQSIYTSEQLAITASTGVAAINIQGTTVHRFARVGLGEKTVQQYVDLYNKNRANAANLRKVTVLIVDEISMLDGDLLDKIESICRKVRGNESKAFGGIKVVFCGDFFQLPPVNRDRTCRMAFEASCWSRVVDKVFILKTTFRQKDPGFIKILNEVRHGCLSDESERILESLNRTPRLEAGIVPTELYSLVRLVETSNNDMLSQLPGEELVYEANDFVATVYHQRDLDNFRAPKTLTIKQNAQVMLIKNLSPTLANGSVGKVVGFEKVDDELCPIYTSQMESKG
ncbi:unnamed protein product [Mucor hiemalis]